MSAPPCTDCGGPLGYCVAPCPASPLREDEQHLVDEFLASFTPADRAAIALREALRRYTGMEGVQGVEVEGSPSSFSPTAASGRTPYAPS